MVPTDDPAALTGAIVRLLFDRALADGLGAQGLERSARYDWTRVTDEILEVYTNAIAVRGALRGALR